MYRLALIVTFAATLGACGISGPDPAAKLSLEQMIEPARQQAAHDRSASSDRKAMAMLPSDAGSIKKISREVLVDGTQQLISYDHAVPGLKTNEVRIALLTPTANPRLEQALENSALREAPTEAGIRAELASEFPRMQMRIVDTPRSNDYGAYGLAAGQWKNGARCVYAWQWVDSPKPEGPASGRLAASLRIRLCRSDMTLDQLASFVDRLKIDPSPQHANVQASFAEAIVPQKPLRKRPAEPAYGGLTAKPSAAASAGRHVATSAAAFPSLQPSSRSADMAAQLDPTMPAAAYRGPSTVARAGNQP